MLGSVFGSHLEMVAAIQPLGLADPVPKGHSPVWLESSLVQWPLHKPRSSPASVSGRWGGIYQPWSRVWKG